MFDVIGVGICIACISYLCCIYTTTLMARSASNPRRRQKRSKLNPSQKKSPEPTMTKCNEKKMQYSKSTRRRCPCAEARCVEQTNFTLPVARRRICLVASSFLDIDSAEGDCGSDGRCKRPDSERPSTGDTKYLFCTDSPRRKESRQFETPKLKTF